MNIMESRRAVTEYAGTTAGKSEGTPAGKSEDGRADKQGSKHKVLFIDDNRLLLTTVAHLLQGTGFELLSADNPFMGLCLLLEQRPQQVFIDANTRRLDGFEFCLLVKQQTQCRHIAIVLVLEDYHPALEAKAKAAGARAILLKPFGGKELEKLLL